MKASPKLESAERVNSLADYNSIFKHRALAYKMQWTAVMQGLVNFCML